ncbi:MAG: flagellar biosynthetic protein FliO [Treponema sp.]|nr:flagellar biosynthetic protein FliO [Treponema sp.]
MKSSKKFIAVLCLFSFVFCALSFAQSAVEGASESNTVSEESKPLNQNKIDESLLTLDGTSDATGVANQSSSSPLRTVWVFFRMILVLGIVLAIVWIIFKLMKRSTDPGNSTDEFLRKVSSLTISPGKSVQIVTLIDKAYLLGVSDNSVNLITEIEDPELIQAMNLYADKNGRVERPKLFEDVLELFMPKKKKKEINNFRNTNAFEDGASRQILDSLKKQSQRLERGE